jgi:hypothetical protein
VGDVSLINSDLGSDRSPLNKKREPSPSAPDWRSTRRIYGDLKRSPKRISNVLKTRRRRTWQTYVNSPSCTRLCPDHPLTSDQIQRILEATGEVNLFKFIINPDDFAQSVENLFNLSFLIRDGSCSLDVESGAPMICECRMYLDQTRTTAWNSQRRKAHSRGVR